jgi:hypothetical protein
MGSALVESTGSLSATRHSWQDKLPSSVDGLRMQTRNSGEGEFRSFPVSGARMYYL